MTNPITPPSGARGNAPIVVGGEGVSGGGLGGSTGGAANSTMQTLMVLRMLNDPQTKAALAGMGSKLGGMKRGGSFAGDPEAGLGGIGTAAGGGLGDIAAIEL